MRPRTLDEFVGQGHIVGSGRLLRRAIAADQLSSLIFYGPPGTGKTTLARVIAGTTRARFEALNAVLAGVKDLRAAIAVATEERDLHGRRTILFVDEVHRWNKAQQDALLPAVENGTLILIGATTENPYFEVIKPLVSRSRIFQLQPLDTADLEQIARGALLDSERGLGNFSARLEDDALAHLLNVANGDARSLLNALELAVTTTPPGPDGSIIITRSVAAESIQKRAVLYDKEGDAHYDTISAFIKSVRGSDPDATLYWLARMVYAGEDPRFLFRRMLVLAAEDVGLADPNAISVVAGCAAAYDYVGLPEGRFHLAEAAIYLATAEKSNTTLAFFDALKAVEEEHEHDIPAHLKDGNRDAEGFGHGEGYLYPHAYDGHWVAQQYLPGQLQGRLFYQPTNVGHEAGIAAKVARQREASLAAAHESQLVGIGGGEQLIARGNGADAPIDRWLQRAAGSTSQRLSHERDALIEAASLDSHFVVLDLSLGAGLVTLELLRRCTEGGVWAMRGAEAAAELAEQLLTLPTLSRPTVCANPSDLGATADAMGTHFDVALGRNPFSGKAEEDTELLHTVVDRLAEGGRLVVAQSLRTAGPRLHTLFAEAGVADADRELLAAAEEAALSKSPDLDAATVVLGAGATLGPVAEVEHRFDGGLAITTGLVEHLFGIAQQGAPYAASLRAAGAEPATLARLTGLLRSRVGQSVPWSWHFVIVSAAALKP